MKKRTTEKAFQDLTDDQVLRESYRAERELRAAAERHDALQRELFARCIKFPTKQAG